MAQLEDPLQQTVSLCLTWLSYGAGLREYTDLPVKIASYSEGSSGDGEHTGLYIIALRQAQMHWAARSLPAFYADTAMAIRRHRDRLEVVRWLYQNYGDDWSAWRVRWPFNPFGKLHRHIAEMMAERLGEHPL